MNHHIVALFANPLKPPSTGFGFSGASFTILIIASISLTLLFGHMFIKFYSAGRNPAKSSLNTFPFASSKICFISEVKA